MKSQDIVAEAREWIGTPFIHQQSAKGVGCDCIGLVRGVADHFNIAYTMPEDYSRMPDNTIRHWCDKNLVQVPASSLQPGDILVMRFLNRAQHFGIYTGDAIIHCYEGGPGRVIQHVLDDSWKARIVFVYRLPGVEDGNTGD